MSKSRSRGEQNGHFAQPGAGRLGYPGCLLHSGSLSLEARARGQAWIAKRSFDPSFGSIQLFRLALHCRTAALVLRSVPKGLASMHGRRVAAGSPPQCPAPRCRSGTEPQRQSLRRATERPQGSTPALCWSTCGARRSDGAILGMV